MQQFADTGYWSSDIAVNKHIIVNTYGMFKETEVGITEMSKQQKSKHKDMYNNVSPKPKAKINKWDYIKIKHFCKAKKFISKMKRQPTENH